MHELDQQLSAAKSHKPPPQLGELDTEEMLNSPKLMHNIAAFVDAMAQSHPGLAAIIDPRFQPPLEISYKQLAERCHRLAHGLAASGIRAGDRVAVFVPPSLDFFALTFALMRLKAIPLFIDPGMGVKGVKHCLNQMQPQVFVGIPKAHIARWLFGWCRGKLRSAIAVGGRLPGTLSLESLLEKGSTAPHHLAATDPDDTAAILFTSGSTGPAKGVRYQHRQFLAQIRCLKQVYGIEPGEVDLCTFPLFALFAPALGMTSVIPDMDFSRPITASPDKIFATLSRYQASNFFASPALLKKLGSALQKNPQLGQVSSLRRLISAGAPMAVSTLNSLEPLLKHNPNAQVYTPYGATECLPVCNISGDFVVAEAAAKTAEGAGVCVGNPVPGAQVRLIPISDGPVDPEHWSSPVEPGEIGEIVVTAEQVTTGYVDNPTATEHSKHRDTDGRLWHRMGDVGYFDPDGCLWYCGRKNHRVTTSLGTTLYSVCVESWANARIGDGRTALVGVPHSRQRKPVLIVEAIAKAQQSGVRKALLTYLKNHKSYNEIDTVLFHKSFPVDVRHNAKIFREKLQVWAESQIKKGD